MMIHSDLTLARRLEAAEMQLNAAAVEKEARLRPATGAAQLEFAGGRAFYMGVDSPLTQCIGAGLHSAVSEAEFEAMETFFRTRGSAANLEVCPLADISMLTLLAHRGYRPVEFSSALYREIANLPVATDEIVVHRAAPEEVDDCVRLVVEGFFGPAAPPSMVELCAVLSDTKHSGLFLATLNGEPIAGGAMGIWQGVACLFGDGTPKRYRGRGGQSALIRARLAAAAEAGCHVALAYTMCDSTSQRNYERAGFQVAYTRTKWCREFLAGAEKT